jgi:hypothetical protein
MKAFEKQFKNYINQYEGKEILECLKPTYEKGWEMALEWAIKQSNLDGNIAVDTIEEELNGSD